MPDRGLEVAAHPGRDHGRALDGSARDRRRRPSASRANASSGSRSERRHCHHPAQLRARGGRGEAVAHSAGDIGPAGRSRRGSPRRQPPPGRGRPGRGADRPAGRDATAARSAPRPARPGRPSARHRRSGPPTAPCCAAADRRSATEAPARRMRRCFGAASWSRFSPTSVTPSSASKRDVAGREGLGDRRSR